MSQRCIRSTAGAPPSSSLLNLLTTAIVYVHEAARAHRKALQASAIAACCASGALVGLVVIMIVRAATTDGALPLSGAAAWPKGHPAKGPIPRFRVAVGGTLAFTCRSPLWLPSPSSRTPCSPNESVGLAAALPRCHPDRRHGRPLAHVHGRVGRVPSGAGAKACGGLGFRG